MKIISNITKMEGDNVEGTLANIFSTIFYNHGTMRQEKLGELRSCQNDRFKYIEQNPVKINRSGNITFGAKLCASGCLVVWIYPKADGISICIVYAAQTFYVVSTVTNGNVHIDWDLVNVCHKEGKKQKQLMELVLQKDFMTVPVEKPHYTSNDHPFVT